MATPPSLFEAARREMEEYKLAADLRLQPKWDVPETVAIHTAISGRPGAGQGDQFPTEAAEFLQAASEVIEAGAASVHLDFSWTDELENPGFTLAGAYRSILDPLRARFGTSFVSDCNVLVGRTFDESLAPAREGLAEMAPIAPGHPDEFMIPAYKALEEAGVKPTLALHHSGEIELAKRKLIDTGIVKPPFMWGLLFGLPFDSGRTLLSGTWVPNTRDLARHLLLMVDQIRSIDPDPVIVVCAAGRAGLYTASLAMMLGLHVRVGTEDTIWRHPNSDELIHSNLEMFEMTKQLAELHGRKPATADEWRGLLDMPTPALAQSVR